MNNDERSFALMSLMKSFVTTEIDAATMEGQHAEGLLAEFEQLSNRLLERAQSA